jgi:hypothetical protein
MYTWVLPYPSLKTHKAHWTCSPSRHPTFSLDIIIINEDVCHPPGGGPILHTSEGKQWWIKKTLGSLLVKSLSLDRVTVAHSQERQEGQVQMSTHENCSPPKWQSWMKWGAEETILQGPSAFPRVFSGSPANRGVTWNSAPSLHHRETVGAMLWGQCWW